MWWYHRLKHKCGGCVMSSWDENCRAVLYSFNAVIIIKKVGVFCDMNKRIYSVFLQPSSKVLILKRSSGIAATVNNQWHLSCCIHSFICDTFASDLLCTWIWFVRNSKTVILFLCTTVHTARVPAPHNHSQHYQRRTPYAAVHTLVLLMMGIMMPETCWDSLIINIRLVASCLVSLSPPYAVI